MLLLLSTLDLIANSVVAGAPIWIFFFQGPLLFSFMGRDKFIHPMMKLTSLLFRWTLPTFALVSFLCSLLASFVNGNGSDNDLLSSLLSLLSAPSAPIISSGLSLLMILINSVYVVPIALKAGLRGMKTANQSKDVRDFVVDGGSQTTHTKTLHQRVILVVLLSELFSILHIYHVITEIATTTVTAT